MEGSIPVLIRLLGLGERHELSHSGVRGEAPAENDFIVI